MTIYYFCNFYSLLRTESYTFCETWLSFSLSYAWYNGVNGCLMWLLVATITFKFALAQYFHQNVLSQPIKKYGPFPLAIIYCRLFIVISIPPISCQMKGHISARPKQHWTVASVVWLSIHSLKLQSLVGTAGIYC